MKELKMLMPKVWEWLMILIAWSLGLIMLIWLVVGVSMVVDIYKNSHNKYAKYVRIPSPPNENPFNEVRGFYESPHKLRKMFVQKEKIETKEPSKASLFGGFFLFIGGVSGKYEEGATTKYEVTHVRFAWEINDNIYIITTLPIEKIRIKLVEKVKTPVVSFFLDEPTIIDSIFQQNVFGESGDKDLRRVLVDYYNPSEAFARYLSYVIFTVRSEDWPQNINLPSGGFDQ